MRRNPDSIQHGYPDPFLARIEHRLLAVPGRIAGQLVCKGEREIAVAVRDALLAALNDAADDLEQPAPDANAPGPREC